MVKKGQMKMQQTAFMLIALTLFFVLVGLFILSTVISSNQNAKETLDEVEAMKLISRLAASPELTCGDSFSISFGSCVDLDKAFVLSENVDKYSELWSVKGIELRKIYPNSTITCTRENYPNCGILQILPNNGLGNDKSTFVSICRKEKDDYSTYDKCELARLIVRFSEGENATK